MRICLICVEIFAWGKYGGFGRATRMLGRELVRRGMSVDAVVPRRKGQHPRCRLRLEKCRKSRLKLQPRYWKFWYSTA